MPVEAADILQPLRAYDVDDHTGFVPAVDPLERLPAQFAPWEHLAADLSPLIRSRGIRAALRALATLDHTGLRSGQEKERALLILSVFANAWVWGGAQPDLRIPSPVAIPLCAIARMLDRPAIVHYGSMTLNNWRRIDSRHPVLADNARMQIQFLGGVDEDWFFMASLGVELQGAPLLHTAHAATVASHRAEDAILATLLERIAAGMNPVLDALERMREWCDPYVFYHRVRPLLTGWPEPGVVYEGVSESPRKYIGGSAGQSSLIQIMDALLGIVHDVPVGNYLRSVRSYMPAAHRRFVLDVEQQSCVRARAAKGSATLQAAYNAAVAQVDLFRERHIALARDYVVKPAGMDPDVKGTGGTSLVDFLRSAQIATARTGL